MLLAPQPTSLVGRITPTGHGTKYTAAEPETSARKTPGWACAYPKASAVTRVSYGKFRWVETSTLSEIGSAVPFTSCFWIKNPVPEDPTSISEYNTVAAEEDPIPMTMAAAVAIGSTFMRTPWHQAVCADGAGVSEEEAQNSAVRVAVRHVIAEVSPQGLPWAMPDRRTQTIRAKQELLPTCYWRATNSRLRDQNPVSLKGRAPAFPEVIPQTSANLLWLNRNGAKEHSNTTESVTIGAFQTSNSLCPTQQPMRNVLSALALVAFLAGAVVVYVATTPAVACMGSRC